MYAKTVWNPWGLCECEVGLWLVAHPLVHAQYLLNIVASAMLIGSVVLLPFILSPKTWN